MLNLSETKPRYSTLSVFPQPCTLVSTPATLWLFLESLIEKMMIKFHIIWFTCHRRVWWCQPSIPIYWTWVATHPTKVLTMDQCFRLSYDMTPKACTLLHWHSSQLMDFVLPQVDFLKMFEVLLSFRLLRDYKARKL